MARANPPLPMCWRHLARTCETLHIPQRDRSVPPSGTFDRPTASFVGIGGLAEEACHG